MSGRYHPAGAEKPANSLLNAFVPEDLVMFSMVPPLQSTNYSLPPNALAPAAGVGEMISEIDLTADDDVEIIRDSVSTPVTNVSLGQDIGSDYQRDELALKKTIEPEFGVHNSIEAYPSASYYFTEPPKVSTTEFITTGLQNVTNSTSHDVYETRASSLQFLTDTVSPVVLSGSGVGGQQNISSVYNKQPNESPCTSLSNEHIKISPCLETHPVAPVDVAMLPFLNDVTSSAGGRHDESTGTSSPSVLIPNFSAVTRDSQKPEIGSIFVPSPSTEIPNQILSGDAVWPLGQLGKTSGASTNCYRIGRQKPVYAKFPGLGSDAAQVAQSYQQPIMMPLPIPNQGTIENSVPPLGNVEYLATAPPLGNVEYFAPAPPPSLPHQQHITTSPFHPSTEPNATSFNPFLHHWFYRKDGEPWKAFSHVDSTSLEEAFSQGSKNLVSVDSGRHDVDLEKRIRQPVYWEDTDVTHVQRCTWFYKGPMDSQYMPYSESFSEKLEEEYQASCHTNTWQKRLEFTGGEAVVLQGPNSFVHFCQQASADEWGSVPESQLRPRTVKRGSEGLQIPPTEPSEIDYLVFLIHGIGSFCDFKFRTVVETVDDFRQISNQLLQSHFRDVPGRVEFLPIQWHKALHGDGGIDEKLKPLTLKSIPKLRHFTNDTLLDILFYTSPVYCQTIMNTVGNEMNRIYSLFLDRNPTFNCLSVAVAGHSLGSLILFDLLQHQPELVPMPKVDLNKEGPDEVNANFLGKDQVEADAARNHLISYRMGIAGTGQPSISYPVLDFQPTAFFAMGSPIAMFVAVRGLDSLGLDFHFPTCPAFFNIFHPYDPVAYRIESLIDPTQDLRPVLIPHHKGRKRFHLELKETMARVGTDLKKRVMESLRVTYKAVTQLAGMAEVESEVDNAIASAELNRTSAMAGERSEDEKKRVGSLNGGRRIDYVLQEAPHQILNEYLFALSSHVCYWESEDTVLLILNEILNEGRSTLSTPEPSSPVLQPTPTNVFSFPTQPQQTVQQPPHINAYVPPPPIPGSFYSTGKRPLVDPLTQRQPMGMDPTAPLSAAGGVLPPPPKSGFRPKF